MQNDGDYPGSAAPSQGVTPIGDGFTGSTANRPGLWLAGSRCLSWVTTGGKTGFFWGGTIWDILGHPGPAFAFVGVPPSGGVFRKHRLKAELQPRPQAANIFS